HEGRYRHPDDAGEKPAQDGFQGYGQTRTDARGQYQFLTIKPTAYGSRPPHVHFRIDDGNQRLTTQMYFPGETKEAGMLGRMAASLWASDRSLLTAKIAETDNGLDAVFNLRL
ncbi:MAG: intradiol ring-cleavage dioxygenase, partial [Burkholderiaceae bacterium]